MVFVTNYIRKPCQQELHRLYSVEQKSLRAIAELFGANATTIRRWCHEFGIAVRTHNEATVDANKRRDWSDYPSITQTQARKNLKGMKREIITRYKVQRGCQRCGEAHPAVLDLHHLDSEQKHPRLRSYVTGSGRGRIGGRGWVMLSYKDIKAEFEKCEVLCSNCHRKETAEQREGKGD